MRESSAKDGRLDAGLWNLCRTTQAHPQPLTARVERKGNMGTENKAGAESGAAVGCSAWLGRALDRMNARREWLLERKARAMECSDTLQAAGWGIRAAGVADAIDIIEALKSERPNTQPQPTQAETHHQP